MYLKYICQHIYQNWCFYYKMNNVRAKSSPLPLANQKHKHKRWIKEERGETKGMQYPIRQRGKSKYIETINIQSIHEWQSSYKSTAFTKEFRILLILLLRQNCPIKMTEMTGLKTRNASVAPF